MVAGADWMPRKCSSDAKAKQSRAGAGEGGGRGGEGRAVDASLDARDA